MGRHGKVLRAMAGDARPDTVRARAQVWRRVEAFTGKRLDKLTPVDVRRWWASTATTGGKDGRGCSPASRAAYLAHLRAYYRATGHPDPTAGIRSPRVARGAPRGLDPEQRAAVLAAYPVSSELGVILRLMMVLGLRRGEVATLRPASLYTDPGGVLMLRVDGKGGYVRDLPVPSWFAGPLAGYSFTVRPRDWYSSEVRAALRACGIDATAHQLRHTAGTTAYQTSHDIVAVQRQLGHRNVSTTMVYAAPARDAIARTLEALAG